MASNKLDLNDIPDRMSVIIEKVESVEESIHRRQKEMLALRLVAFGVVLGIVVSLCMIVLDRNPDTVKLAWHSLNSIICLAVGAAFARKF